MVSVLAAVTLSGSPSASAQQPGTQRLPKGITPETKAAIDRGLAYLARTQNQHGAWTNRGGYGEYPVAMTALAGLALLMDGNTTTQGRYAPQVDRALRYLVQSVGSGGLIARSSKRGRPMYGHGFSMLFLSQLAGMIEDPVRAQEVHEVLTRAVTLSGKAQSHAGGWYYTPNSRSDEGSVTITQVQALRSCRNVGVAVPKAVIDSAMAYLAISQNSDGGIRYSVNQRGGQSRPAITAAAVCCWFNAGEYADPRAKRALAFCKEKVKPLGAAGGHDYYAHLYFAQALYVSKDTYWDEYFAKRRKYLLGRQRSDGSWWGDGVGDIYGTAAALIILQLPFNQLPIMQQ
jgi:hypothetical protein